MSTEQLVSISKCLEGIEKCLDRYETHLLEIAKHIQGIEQLLKERLPNLASKEDSSPFGT